MLMTKRDPNAKWWLKYVPHVKTWSNINILRFLRHYESHPVLWNVHARQYQNVCMRRQAYKHIIELLNLRGVDIDECMRLVEWLKKKYIVEKGVKTGKCEKKPTWFEIIKRIVARILNPEEKDWDFQCCTQCCTCETPSSTTVSSDYQACKNCCADQNIHPPCEYYKSCNKDDDEDDEANDNPCNFEKVECYNICNNEMKVVLLNIGQTVKKYNSDCDCKTDESDADRNSDCDCKNDDGSSKNNDWNCDCCCKPESLPHLSDLSFDKNDDDSCKCPESSIDTTKSLPSVSTVANFCIQPMPECPSETSSSSGSSSSTITDERSTGIFMASQRFDGKRISLVDEYACNDCGVPEILMPRLHLARCCCASDKYPLQLDL